MIPTDVVDCVNTATAFFITQEGNMAKQGTEVAHEVNHEEAVVVGVERMADGSLTAIVHISIRVDVQDVEHQARFREVRMRIFPGEWRLS